MKKYITKVEREALAKLLEDYKKAAATGNPKKRSAAARKYFRMKAKY